MSEDARKSVTAEEGPSREVSNHSKVLIDGEWRKGLILEERINATTEDEIHAAIEALEMPVRKKLENALGRIESEAKAVARLHGYSSTLEKLPESFEGNTNCPSNAVYVGMSADPCTPLAFAHQMEFSTKRIRRWLNELDTEDLPDEVMWTVVSLVQEALSVMDNRMLLNVAQLEREVISGRGQLKQKNGAPPELQRKAVQEYNTAQNENLSLPKPQRIGVTNLKTRIAEKYGVSRATVSNWIKIHQ